MVGMGQNRLNRTKRRNHHYTVGPGGKSCGRSRPPPGRGMERRAVRTSRRVTPGWRPRGAGFGNNGSLRTPPSAGRSGGYRFGFRSLTALPHRVSPVHMKSRNHILNINATLFSNGLSHVSEPGQADRSAELGSQSGVTIISGAGDWYPGLPYGRMALWRHHDSMRIRASSGCGRYPY